MSFQIKTEVKDGKVKAGLKTIATKMPKVLKRDLGRALEWARAIIRGHWPEGGRQGYTIPFTPKQQKGERGAYVRTGAYGAGWQIKNIPGKTAIYLYNPVYYARYVGGDAYGNRQAEIHRGRWPIAFDVVKTAFDTVLRQYLDKDLEQMLRDAGFGL